MKTTFACGLLLVLLCLAVAALAAPPKVSEEFSSIIRVTLADKTGSTPNITGHGTPPPLHPLSHWFCTPRSQLLLKL